MARPLDADIDMLSRPDETKPLTASLRSRGRCLYLLAKKLILYTRTQFTV